jgi:hypothetical protein
MDAEATQLVWAVLLQYSLTYPLWRIFGRAGLNPRRSLINLVPVVGVLVTILVLCASEWWPATASAAPENTTP